MKYNVLLFDADGTLFDFHKSEEIAFRKVLEYLKADDRFEELFSIYMEENHKIWRELEQGKISQETLKVERFKRFLDRTHITANETEVASIFMSSLSEASILFDDAYELIKTLSESYTILIVTNGLKEVQQKRIRHSILSPFIKATIISDEINIQKPDPRIIDYALAQIHHHSKDDVIIIGDSLTSDIKGGINANIDTMWYNPEGKENPYSFRSNFIVKSLKDIKTILYESLS